MAANWSIEHESGMVEYEAEAELVVCRECGELVEDGDVCDACGMPTDGWILANEENDCPLDGDAESALASCGWGVDEDYEHYDAW